MIVAQFFLIILKKQSVDSKTYLFTEVIFKVFLSLYLEYLLFASKIRGIEWEDTFLISFAGGLLFYDGVFHDLPALLKQYGINYNL